MDENSSPTSMRLTTNPSSSGNSDSCPTVPREEDESDFPVYDSIPVSVFFFFFFFFFFLIGRAAVGTVGTESSLTASGGVSVLAGVPLDMALENR